MPRFYESTPLSRRNILCMGGVAPYEEELIEVAANGYPGFTLTK
jgi:hypothetical protein